MSDDNKLAPVKMREWTILAYHDRKDHEIKVEGDILFVGEMIEVVEKSDYTALQVELESERSYTKDVFQMLHAEEAQLEIVTKECEEQARLNGVGAERELRLLAEVERLKKTNIKLALEGGVILDRESMLRHALEAALAREEKLMDALRYIVETATEDDLIGGGALEYIATKALKANVKAREEK